jgi:hypothetical protein
MNSYTWYRDKIPLVLTGELFHDSAVIPPDTNTPASIY